MLFCFSLKLLWNNTMYNSRYIPSYVPSTTARRNYSMPSNQQRIIPPYVSSQQSQQTYQVPNERVTQSGPPYYQQTNNEYESYNNNNMPNYNRSQNQKVNRGLTYATNGQNYQSHPPGQNNQPHLAPPGKKRRVQIIDQNRQTPSTVGNGFISSRNGYNSTHGQSYPTSDLPKSQQRTGPIQFNQNRDHTDENKFGYQPNNTNIHEYLYGTSEPDPG